MNIEKIIIRAPNWLGDCIMATPMLRRLRELKPEARISVLGLRAYLDIFSGNPGQDELLFYDSLRMSRDFRSAVSDLWTRGFDLGYLLPNSFSSALLFALGGVKRRVGYKEDGRGILLNEPRVWPGQVEHRVVRYLRLVDPQATAGELAKSYRAEIFTSLEDELRADELLAGVNTKMLCALNPCSITPTRRWLPECFAELAGLLHEELGAEILLLGGPFKEDQETTAKVAALSRKARITNLAGKTNIKTLSAVLRRAKLLITGNTGTMHIASAAGTPMIILPGSSDIEVTSPWGGSYKVIHKNLDCYPCWKNTCPKGPGIPKCLTDISVDEVMEVVKRVLRSL